MTETINFYRQFIINPALLANGQQIILEYLSNQNNRKSTLQNLLSTQVPILTLIGSIYPRQVYPQTSQQQRQFTRKFLLSLVSQLITSNQNTRILQNIFVMIKKIHDQQGYQQWLTIYAQLIQSCNSNSFYWLITRILSGADGRIQKLAVQLFVFILHNYTKYSLGIQQLLHCILLCLRGMSHLCGTDQQTLQKFYRPYQSQVVDLVWANLNTSPLCMLYSLKILTLLYSQMQLTQTQSQSSKNNCKGLGQFGLRVANQYVNFINQNKIVAIDQLQQNQNQPEQNNIQSNIINIIYQLYQLYDVLMSDQQYEADYASILMTIIVGTFVNNVQLPYWLNNTQSYLLSLQDQSQRSLRNRSVSLLNTLIQQNQKKQTIKKLITQYFQTVVGAISTNNLQLIPNFFKANLGNGILTLPDMNRIQESSYFLLLSLISILYPKQNYSNIMQFLLNRIQVGGLVSVISLLVVVRNFTEGTTQTLKKILINLCQNISSVNSQNLGLIISICIGFGKLAKKNKIGITQIGQQFLRAIVNHLQNSQNKPDQDSTHIVLQLLINVSQKTINSAQNSQVQKSILARIVSPEIQVWMVKNYLHDGLLSHLVINLLQYVGGGYVIPTIMSLLPSVNVPQVVPQLVGKWIKSSIVSIQAIQQILPVLINIHKSNLSLISPIVKNYLKFYIYQKASPNSNILEIVNNYGFQQWGVWLMMGNWLQNKQQKIVLTTKKLLQVTSQTQFEFNLTLIQYLSIKPQDALNLKNLLNNNGLYKQLIQKYIAYSALFQGKNLKIVTGISLFNIAQHDDLIKQSVANVIGGYGNVQVNQWQDQDAQDGQDQQDIIERILGGKLQNTQLQDQLQMLFGQYIWDTNLKLLSEKLFN